MRPDAQTLRGRATRATWIAVALTLALAALIALHQRPFNGPPYYPWTFARLPLAPSLAVVALIAAHVALLYVAVERVRRFWLGVALLTAGTFALRVGIAATLSDPVGLDNAAALVREPSVGSFFTAARVVDTIDWRLSDYPELMPQFPLHARHKAPGPMLFWSAMIRVAGGDIERASRAGILIVGAIAAAAVPLAAAFALRVRAGTRVARHVAAIVSLLPGAIVFFPLFDPAYLTWSLALLTLWFAALDGKAWRAVAFGLALAVTLFLVFNVLPIGLYLALAGVAFARHRAGGDWLARFASRSAIALAAAIVGIIAMRLLSGYDAVATLRTAIDQQADMQRTFGDQLRPYPQTIGWDLYDAALGVGFAPAALAVAALFAGRRIAVMAACGLTTCVVVAVAALLPVETARVWCFLFPVLALPAAAVVARASPAARVAFYVAIAAALFAMVTSLLFVSVAPVIFKA